MIQLCPAVYNPMNCSTPGFPVLHSLPEFAQAHLHWVSNAILSSHPTSSPSLPALDLSQHQGLFQWVESSCHVAKYWNFSFIDWGIDLFYCDVKHFALEMNWDHSVVFRLHPSTAFWTLLLTMIRSDQISHSVVSDSLRPHESQHARPPCPSPTSKVNCNKQNM